MNTLDKFLMTFINKNNVLIAENVDSGYPHDGGADKDSYPHDNKNQCIILRLQLSFVMINVQVMLV